MENNVGLIIKTTREELGISQRELARKANVDNTEISRIESGKRQKPNILVLKNIAEVLDLSLVRLMRDSGYSENDINYGHDLEDKRSLRDYKNIIMDYQAFYYDVLDDMSKRRKNDFYAKKILLETIDLIEFGLVDNDKLKKKILTKLEKVNSTLKNNLYKYDESKYPNYDPIIQHNFINDSRKALKHLDPSGSTKLIQTGPHNYLITEVKD